MIIVATVTGLTVNVSGNTGSEMGLRSRVIFQSGATVFYHRTGMANLLNWWVKKFKVVDRKNKKTWVTDVIIFTRGLTQVLPKSVQRAKKKKIFTSEIPCFPSSMTRYRKISFSSQR